MIFTPSLCPTPFVFKTQLQRPMLMVFVVVVVSYNKGVIKYFCYNLYLMNKLASKKLMQQEGPTLKKQKHYILYYLPIFTLGKFLTFPLGKYLEQTFVLGFRSLSCKWKTSSHLFLTSRFLGNLWKDIPGSLN